MRFVQPIRETTQHLKPALFWINCHIAFTAGPGDINKVSYNFGELVSYFHTGSLTVWSLYVQFYFNVCSFLLELFSVTCWRTCHKSTCIVRCRCTSMSAVRAVTLTQPSYLLVLSSGVVLVSLLIISGSDKAVMKASDCDSGLSRRLTRRVFPAHKRWLSSCTVNPLLRLQLFVLSNKRCTCYLMQKHERKDWAERATSRVMTWNRTLYHDDLPCWFCSHLSEASAHLIQSSWKETEGVSWKSAPRTHKLSHSIR